MTSASLRAAATLAFLTSFSVPATALCSGGTVAEEFARATVVVRARLVSELRTSDDEPSEAYRRQWGDEGTVVTLYGLRVADIFKGQPKPRISIFMEHSSGAFYVDHDKDYLLFLEPSVASPEAANGTFTVRYSCGQSKPWSEVAPQDLAELHKLSGPAKLISPNAE
jgi:hypothetical protein